MVSPRSTTSLPRMPSGSMREAESGRVGREHVISVGAVSVADVDEVVEVDLGCCLDERGVPSVGALTPDEPQGESVRFLHRCGDNDFPNQSRCNLALAND